MHMHIADKICLHRDSGQLNAICSAEQDFCMCNRGHDNKNMLQGKLWRLLSSRRVKPQFSNIIRSKIMFNYRFVRKMTAWVDSADFRLPRQSFVSLPFSSVRLVGSNSENLVDHWGIFTQIFWSNFELLDLRVVR